jgi:hypothetical protein
VFYSILRKNSFSKAGINCISDNVRFWPIGLSSKTNKIRCYIISNRLIYWLKRVENYCSSFRILLYVWATKYRMNSSFERNLSPFRSTTSHHFVPNTSTISIIGSFVWFIRLFHHVYEVGDLKCRSCLKNKMPLSFSIAYRSDHHELYNFHCNK